VGFRALLCRHYGCELQIPIDPPYRFFNRDYSVFDCGGTAFNEVGLKPLVRVCYSVPGELHPCVMLRNVLGYLDTQGWPVTTSD